MGHTDIANFNDQDARVMRILFSWEQRKNSITFTLFLLNDVRYNFLCYDTHPKNTDLI